MRVNVILHGVFGYIFREENIHVYTPAICGHMYKAGGKDFNTAEDLRRSIEYSLVGVCGDPGARPSINPTCHPALPLDSNAEIDHFGKRFGTLRLPYPKIGNFGFPQFNVTDSYILGKVYRGKHADPLNGLEEWPSVLVLVYERHQSDKLALTAKDGSHSIDLSHLKPNPDDDSVNVHIWCTINPLDMSLHEGHIRKAFAALIDMFPHEVTLEIPDGFTPQACEDANIPGVTRCDVDPGREKCPGRFGKVNCHYAMLMFVPMQ